MNAKTIILTAAALVIGIAARAQVWPESQEGIRSVGILDMQIYRLERRVFMIMALWKRSSSWILRQPRLKGSDRQKDKSG